MRILISAANSDISIAIARIIRLVYPQAFLVGAAPDGMFPGRDFYHVMEKLPFATDELHYIDHVKALLKQHCIDLFVPISEKELSYLASCAELATLGKMVMNSPGLLETCLDKFKTYLWLQEIQVRVPETHLIHENIPVSIPFILKPRRSAGSKNMFCVKSSEFLQAIRKEYAGQIDQYLMQRQISHENQEYTCALWRYGNDFRFLILHRKLQGGLTGEACVVNQSDIVEALNKIQKSIVGDFFINVQLRLEEGLSYVFEINPRFSSTVMMRHKIGFQDLLWSLQAVLKLPVSPYQAPALGTRVYRLSDELIVVGDTKDEK